MADALAVNADEGRFKPAKVVGEAAKARDPTVSEWSNPPWRNPRESDACIRWGTRGTEISKYPEEKKSQRFPE
jgi:hypothetical protein